MPGLNRNRRWLYGEELKEKWGITDADLMDYIISGDLVAHDESLAPFDKDEFRKMVSGPFANLSPHWPMAGYDGLRFRTRDVQEAARIFGIVEVQNPGDLETVANNPTDREPASQTTEEDYIKKIKISYDGGFEISIQEPGKKPKNWPCGLIGFENEKSKAWKIFREILEAPDHTYTVGSSKSPGYSRRQKRLSQLEKILRSFFNRNLKLNLPSDLKFIVRCHNKKPGTYGVVFQVTSDVDDEIISEKDRVMDKIDYYSQIYRETDPSEEKKRKEILSQLTPYLEKAYIKGWLTKEEVKGLLHRNEEIIYDPLENEAGREPTY